MSKSSI